MPRWQVNTLILPGRRAEHLSLALKAVKASAKFARWLELSWLGPRTRGAGRPPFLSGHFRKKLWRGTLCPDFGQVLTARQAEMERKQKTIASRMRLMFRFKKSR